jgi:MoaA/NifB/PqqE/SkfB family radical SAM enzyme
MKKVINFLKGFKNLFLNLYSYKGIIFYVFKKRGIRGLYKFLWVKFFVLAGGEGTGNWFISIFEPFLRIFYKITPFIIGYPQVLEIEITTRCNKKCIICEHTYWKEENRDLTFEEFKKIISYFPKLKWVNLTGEGDAFLNKDYFKMIEYLKKRDIFVSLVDSFDLIDENISRKIIELGVDTIYISFDAGTKETYEKIKVGCKFEKTLKNIKTLLLLKEKMNSPIPEIYFRYIINNLNLYEMTKFLEIVHSLNTKLLGPGSRVEFTGLLYFPEVEDLFIPEIPQEIVDEVIQKAKELNIKVSFVHPSHPEKLLSMHYCFAWQEPYIMMGGYVLPCCAVLMSNKREFLRKYSFGNVLEKSFKEIWYSERYKKFREMVINKREKVPILCAGCRAYNTIIREKKYGISKEI